MSDDAKLSWVAWSLLAVWSAAGLLFGGYELIERAVEAHLLAQDPVWHNPFPVMLGPAIWLAWILATIHLGPAGLVVGLVAVTRRRSARTLRVVLLAVIVIGAMVTELAAGALTSGDATVGQDFVHDGRLSALLVLVASVAVVAASYWLLPHLQTRPGAADA